MNDAAAFIGLTALGLGVFACFQIGQLKLRVKRLGEILDQHGIYHEGGVR